VANHNGDGLRSEVFLINADGTNVTRLTYSTGATTAYNHGAWPSGWSSDGSQILFYWYREGYNQLWIMDADGSHQRKLTTDSSWNAIPAMSPDRLKIAFASYRTGNYEIYVMQVDGMNATRLTNATTEDWRPVWSADGTKILFEANRDGRTQIYTMNPDGSQQMRLTDNLAYAGQPAWRPVKP
jgi:Tol biopolymer transport system component